jgi:hypothetical protein
MYSSSLTNFSISFQEFVVLPPPIIPMCSSSGYRKETSPQETHPTKEDSKKSWWSFQDVIEDSAIYSAASLERNDY